MLYDVTATLSKCKSHHRVSDISKYIDQKLLIIRHHSLSM